MQVGRSGRHTEITSLEKSEEGETNEHLHLPNLQENFQIHTIDKFQEMR